MSKAGYSFMLGCQSECHFNEPVFHSHSQKNMDLKWDMNECQIKTHFLLKLGTDIVGNSQGKEFPVFNFIYCTFFKLIASQEIKKSHKVPYFLDIIFLGNRFSPKSYLLIFYRYSNNKNKKFVWHGKLVLPSTVNCQIIINWSTLLPFSYQPAAEESVYEDVNNHTHRKTFTWVERTRKGKRNRFVLYLHQSVSQSFIRLVRGKEIRNKALGK